MPMERFIFTPRGSFSLAQSIRFLDGFTPLAPGGGRDAFDCLGLAFAVEGDWRPVAISARQDERGRVRVTATGEADPRRVRGAIERMLSLDVDGAPLAAAVTGDEVASELVRELEGLRPVCFASPYEAAAWAVISQRIQMRQAARIRLRMCEEVGPQVEAGGVTPPAFPTPEQMLRATSIPGLPAFKVERLHAVARAALDGRLDAATLRAAGPEAALRELQQLPGIGPFGAELVLERGAGEPDHFARSERRLHAAMAAAYAVDPADVDALEEIARGWSPFRSWIGFLFRARSSMAAAA
jgi:3-methyladenine DNA glycosylase/8-oxoguanine DNA glycosylase